MLNRNWWKAGLKYWFYGLLGNFFTIGPLHYVYYYNVSNFELFINMIMFMFGFRFLDVFFDNVTNYYQKLEKESESD